MPAPHMERWRAERTELRDWLLSLPGDQQNEFLARCVRNVRRYNYLSRADTSRAEHLRQISLGNTTAVAAHSDDAARIPNGTFVLRLVSGRSVRSSHSFQIYTGTRGPNRDLRMVKYLAGSGWKAFAYLSSQSELVLWRRFDHLVGTPLHDAALLLIEALGSGVLRPTDDNIRFVVRPADATHPRNLWNAEQPVAATEFTAEYSEWSVDVIRSCRVCNGVVLRAGRDECLCSGHGHYPAIDTDSLGFVRRPAARRRVSAYGAAGNNEPSEQRVVADAPAEPVMSELGTEELL